MNFLNLKGTCKYTGCVRNIHQYFKHKLWIVQEQELSPACRKTAYFGSIKCRKFGRQRHERHNIWTDKEVANVLYEKRSSKFYLNFVFEQNLWLGSAIVRRCVIIVYRPLKCVTVMCFCEERLQKCTRQSLFNGFKTFISIC